MTLLDAIAKTESELEQQKCEVRRALTEQVRDESPEEIGASLLLLEAFGMSQLSAPICKAIFSIGIAEITCQLLRDEIDSKGNG